MSNSEITKTPSEISEGVVSQWAVWRFNGISQMGLPLFYPGFWLSLLLLPVGIMVLGC